MIYEIFHETEYHYASLVTFSHNMVKLKPRELGSQKLLEHTLKLNVREYEKSEFDDFLHNHATHLLVKEPHQNLKVTARSKVLLDEAMIARRQEEIFQQKMSYAELRQRLEGFHEADIFAKQFLFDSELLSRASKPITKYAMESFSANRCVVESVFEFMQRIYQEFQFVAGFSDVTTPVDTIFKAKKGVCQDFAQFAISALRSIGIPTCYVSGYIETLPPPGKEKLFGTDASHAWFSIYLPDFGWIDFDPTNNKIPNEEYITLGFGRDYNDIAPLKGVVQSSGMSTLSVKVDVARIEG